MVETPLLFGTRPCRQDVHALERKASFQRGFSNRGAALQAFFLNVIFIFIKAVYVCGKKVKKAPSVCKER